MSSTKYDSIPNLKTDKYDYKIKVRVIRFWRGVTRTGEEFRSFNVILIDNKKNRIHAFAPTLCAEDLEKKITLGNVCSIKNFTVQLYKATDKFRILRSNKQLIFSKNTKIEDLEDDGVTIPHEVFDFYDHSELKDLSKQSMYLTDVIGIIKKYEDMRNLINQHGQKQSQAKLTITDGRSNVKITLWDAFAEKFAKAMLEPIEQPVIIIISSCRVGVWNEEIDVSNVAATKIYLNYKHHSVLQLRKMLSQPEFAKQAFAQIIKKSAELLTVEDIKKLGKEYIQTKVLTHVNIKSVEQTIKWFFYACTNCGNETKWDNANYICSHCSRIVPHPDKKFKINVVGSDATGDIQIILEDREVRTLIGKRARELIDENLPQCLQNIAQKDYTIMLQITELNIINHLQLYWATNICNSFISPQQETCNTSQLQQSSSLSQQSTSTNNCHGISDLTFNSN